MYEIINFSDTMSTKEEHERKKYMFVAPSTVRKSSRSA